MRTILKIEDLYNIALFLGEKGYNEVPLEITIPVYTKERMAKLNREFCINKNMNPTGDNDNDYVDEINVSIEGVNFKYKLTETPTMTENFDNVEEKDNI